MLQTIIGALAIAEYLTQNTQFTMNEGVDSSACVKAPPDAAGV